jgi:hypothetical protein
MRYGKREVLIVVALRTIKQDPVDGDNVLLGNVD